MKKLTDFFIKYWGWVAGVAIIILFIIFRKKIFPPILADGTPCTKDGNSGTIQNGECIPNNLGGGAQNPPSENKVSENDTIYVRKYGRSFYPYVNFGGVLYKFGNGNGRVAQYNKVPGRESGV